METGFVSFYKFGEVVCEIVDQFRALNVSCNPEHTIDLIDQAVHTEFAHFDIETAIVNLSKVQQVITKVLKNFDLGLNMAKQVFKFINAAY